MIILNSKKRENMVNYGNGKIYSIRSHQTTNIYIGSTTQSLSKRLSDHFYRKKEYEKNKYDYLTSFNLLDFDDVYIELIENYPCCNREELLKREGYFIRKINCINKVIPGRTKKEYYEDNKTSIAQKHKEYREDNKEHLKQKKKEYHKKYREINLEHLKQKKKEYNEKTKEQRKEYQEKNKAWIDRKDKCCYCNKEMMHRNLKKHIKNFHDLKN